MAKLCSQCRYFYHGHRGEPTLCINKESKRFPSKISRNGHNHVCELFRPIKKHNHSVNFSKTKKKDGSHNHPIAGTLREYRGRLRYIERLYRHYLGREIWVLATGPSLEDIPDNFLQIDETIPPDEKGNTVLKIAIAVKEAGIAFPDSTYNLWAFRDRALRDIYLPRGMIPNNFGRFIFSIFKSNRENYFGKQSLKAIYMRFRQGGTLQIMKNVCDSIVAGNSSIYCGVTTITHLAIEAAIVLGASKVSLVGCDHGFPDGKLRAQNRGMSRGYSWKTAYLDGYETQIPGTNFLADYFRPHGIEIVRYYHGKGYERVGKPISEEESAEEAQES